MKTSHAIAAGALITAAIIASIILGKGASFSIIEERNEIQTSREFFRANISETSGLTFDNKTNTFRFIGDNERIDMRLYAVVDGQKRYLDTDFPGIANMIEKRTDSMKFGASVPIPGSIRNRVTEAGFEFSGNTTPIIFNGSINNYSITIDDYMISFDDLAQAGFTVNTSETGVALTNFPNKVQLDLDPTINFSTAAIEAKSIAALDNNTFVLCYCDETADDASFIIFDTNLTNLTAMNGGAIDANNNIGSCSEDSVSCSAFNTTHFIIAYSDDTNDDASFMIWRWNGTNATNTTGEKDADTTAMTGATAISTSCLNSTNAVITFYHASTGTNGRPYMGIYNSDGNSVLGPTSLRTTSDPSQIYGISASAINSTHSIISYMWANGATITLDVSYKNGISNVWLAAEDTSVEGSLMTNVAALNQTHFALLWEDASSSDTTILTEEVDGTDLLPITDIDTGNGGTSRQSITALNSTHYALVYEDFNEVKLYINKSDGTGVYSGTIASASTSPFPTIFSNATATGLGFCKGGIIVTWTDSATSANISAFNSTGGAWDGSCAEEEPPTTTTTTPTTTTTTTVPTADTCTFQPGSQWNINCSDECEINNSNNMEGNILNITGTGTVTLNGNISNWSVIMKEQTCVLRINKTSGGCLGCY